jgi:OmpA-OmpF porin, OOP family
MKIRTRLAFIVAGTLLVAGPVLAQDELNECPYFTAMPSYELSGSDDKEFDAHRFFNGREFVNVEGKLWSKYYELKEGATQASELQITRNYANALKAIGGTVYNEGLCEGEKCGDYQGGKFVSGQASKDGKEVWLELVPHNSGGDYQMIVVEREAMKQDVTASGLLAALNAEGHVALYINFDTNKADIKPESKPIIDQVAAMLKGNPGLSLSVEGHTDSTGTPEKNKVLSEQRAKAVVAALVAAGIDSARLSAVGYGQEKPIADNSTEDGRAKNRRVELVKR